MFDIFKKDVSVGDNIRLHLTNSADKPEGLVLEIGESFVYLQGPDGAKSRFFDKLIGGWDILESKQATAPSALEPGKRKTIVIPKRQTAVPAASPIAAPANTPANAPTNRSPFYEVEKKIFELIGRGETDKAMLELNANLTKPNIDDKYKSSFLLKKAQLFSGKKDYESSENTYKELIEFNENSSELQRNKPALSHYCTELARLQAQSPEKRKLALESVKKALEYKQDNASAKILLQQLESIASFAKLADDTTHSGGRNLEDDDLHVEAGIISTDISGMLEIDFKEHKYINPTIIRNNGVPTTEAADLMLDNANNKGYNIAQRYVFYLDAAKAYSELNVGSYKTENLTTAAAFYALFKGDTIFGRFKNEIIENKIDIDELIKMKDSACSYYLESARLLTVIDPKSLLLILTNYLKMNIVLYFRNNNIKITEKEFDGKFDNVVRSCLMHRDKELEKIVWTTFINFGAKYPGAWNELNQRRGGTGILAGILTNPTSRNRIYNLINSIWGWEPIDTSLLLRNFFQAAFSKRQKIEGELEKAINYVHRFPFEGERIEQIAQVWNNVQKYENLLTITDKETKKAIDQALEIAKPYLKRNPTERTNILISIQAIIEKQIDFINQNTTIYGRAYFFPLLTKWKIEIANLLKERITETNPILEIFVDPPYYLRNDNEIIIPLLIKNIGATTSIGCNLDGFVETNGNDHLDNRFEKRIKEEIPAGGETIVNINFPKNIAAEGSILKLNAFASAINNNNETLKAASFQFTLEEEAGSTLTDLDIPWDDANPPKAHLFKGREAILDMLYKHYLSFDRIKPYILYGLTRTGKTSILNYLHEKINNTSIIIKGKQKKVIPLRWEMGDIANAGNAKEFWEYICYNFTFKELRPFIHEHPLIFSQMKTINEWKAKDFPILIECMDKAGLYPLFMVDEFSYIKSLLDKKTISPAFLATLREISFNEQAGFLFAGTYDIKDLIRNKEYGITGQFVHAIDYQIDKIDDEPAESLINVSDKIHFTDDAVSHIKKLSGNIPYFIQMICKYCGHYAVEKKRFSIGFPELEKVIRILTGSDMAEDSSQVKRLTDNAYQNNQYSPADPPIVSALISSIAWLNRDSLLNPRGIRLAEIHELWDKHKVRGLRPKSADAIKILEEKKILKSEDDEGGRIYKISVDLFRRWWGQHHPDIDLELASISED
ncbi:MAG: hypothetical protein FWG77_04065 [Treponema sp.]|nr:hypothetical protein [Treponema sp.]